MKKDLGWAILLVEVFVALVVFGIIKATTAPMVFSEGLTLTWEVLWAWVAVIYIGASIRVWDVIPAEKIGARLILGIATDTVTAGPPVVPPFIGEIIIVPTATVQREFPDEPEKLFRTLEGGDQNVPEGMKPPLRINFSDSVKADQLDLVLGKMELFPEEGGLRWAWRPGAISTAERLKLSKDRNGFNPQNDSRVIIFNHIVPTDGLSTARITAEVSHISRLRVSDVVALVKTIPPNEQGDRLDEVFRQIEDEQVIALNSVLTKISVAQAQANVDWLNAILFARVEARIKAIDGHSDSWGIDLEGAAVKPIGLNRSLNKAIASVPEARFEKDSTITAAEGAKQKAILEGQGAATAARDLEQQVIVGRGKGLATAAKVTGLPAHELLAAEVAGKVGTGDGTIVIGESGLAQLAAVGSAVAGGLNKKTT